jgi:GAF domain-containing protein
MVSVQGADMARDPKKGGSPGKKRGKKKSASGRRSAPNRPQTRARKSAAKDAKSAKSNRRGSGSGAKAEIARLSRDLREALAQQTATSEVLQVISSSTGDVQPVFDQMLEKATQVCGAEFAIMGLYEGEVYRRVALYNVPPAFAAVAPREFRPAPDGPIGTPRQTGQVFRVDDLSKSETYLSRRNGAVVAMVEVAGVRTIVIVPMVRNGETIGAISIYHQEVRPFTDKQVELLKNFASQAVIAIENARLFNETRESLQQQTATADVLSVIASSPTDVRPVLYAIVESACKLCEASDAYVALMDGDELVFQTQHGSIPVPWKRRPINRQWPAGRAVVDGKPVHVHNVLSLEGEEFPDGQDIARQDGTRTVLTIPLMREGESIGVIILRRTEVQPFTDKQMALLKTFADQAVIAIENVRLFKETKEALERQTATADILKVIASSPSDVQPVFEAIASSANRLLGGHVTAVQRVIEGSLHLAAFTPLNPEADALLKSVFPAPSAMMPFFDLLARGEPHQEPDIEAIPDELPKRIARARGFRSMLFVPLVNAGQTIGLVSVTRVAPGTFAAEDVQLLQTFASQAVIAIENARLFNETREALERQTATSEVLQVISSSPGDLKPVFDQMLAKAMRLCEAQCGFIYQMEQGAMRAVAEIGVPPAFAEYRRQHLHTGGATTPADIMRATKKPAHVHDARDSDAYRQGNPNAVAGVDLGGARTVLYVPMIRNDDIAGVINLYRLEVKPFTDEQIALLENFASQAVIAIENARLFNETKEALERQTATADILKVIASSPDNVQPVFEAIAEASHRLVGAFTSTVLSIADETVHLSAFTQTTVGGDSALASLFPRPLSSVVWGEAVRRGDIHQIVDSEINMITEASREMARLRGWRSALYVPLMRDQKAVGAIAVSRTEPGAFSDHHVQLLRTFSDQAVIAIENVRLFNETKEALAQQTATSEVLSVISNSVADTAPVFEKILDSCEKLFATEQLGIFVVQPDGQTHVGAWRGSAVEVVIKSLPRPVEETATGVVIRNRAVLHIPNTANSPSVPATVQYTRDQFGDISMAWAPMLTEKGGIGSIAVMRQPPNPFSEKELALLKTFADQAVIAIQNTRLFNETKEALARQTATANILKVISSSIADAKPVFDEILRSVEHLFGADGRMILLAGQDGLLHVGAIHGRNAVEGPALFPVPLKGTAAEIAFSERRLITYSDVLNDAGVPEGLRALARRFGRTYSIAVAPMLAEDRAIGVLNVTREPVRPFSEKECALLQTLADQAVIAIENTRLFNETKEALARQTATADVLKVIASSPSNLQPVFDAIAERSKALIGAHSTTVVRYIDNMVELASFTPVSPEADAALRALFPMRPDNDPQFTKVLQGEIARIADAESEIENSAMRDMARARGWRSRLYVPLKDDTGVIGWISVARKEVGEFADKDVELLRTFADQAVIAIQNVELFEEVQARTRDLQESLQQQTATADVLKVISRSAFDLQAVLDTLVESAYRLCGANLGLLYLRGDADFECQAIAGIGIEAASQLFKGRPIRAGRGTAAERVILTGEVHAVTDFFADPDFDPVVRERIRNDSSGSDISQLRSTLAVPMTRENEVVGVLVIARTQPGSFPQRQIELLQTFADQAVIAIENLRLFNETREALARQTATADVLKVIASSPSNLQPVFDAIAARSKELVAGHSTTVFRFAGDMVELVGATSVGADADAVLRATFPMPVSRMRNIERILRGEISEIVDVLADTQPDDSSKDVARARGWRSRLVVPLKGDNAVIGFISITRKEPGAFTGKDKELVRTFADQAVIAIQNVELFEEVQARTRDLEESLQQQTATADVLKVINRAAFDLDAVMNTLVRSARHLCGADGGALFLRAGDALVCRGVAAVKPADEEFLKANPVVPLNDASYIGRAVLTGTIANVGDIENSLMLRKYQQAMGFKAFLAVPLMREGRSVGVFSLVRDRVGEFTPRQIELVQTFADQAVIAVENTRLFEEVQARTHDLEESLQFQTATSDVLKVISRSPDKLQPVLDAIVETSRELCGSDASTIFLFRDGKFHFTAVAGEVPKHVENLRANPMNIDERGSLFGRLIRQRRTLHYGNVMDDPELSQSRVGLGGPRALLVAPLLNQGEVIGALVLRQTHLKPFTDRQIQAIEVFADQAVIAISNVGLFEQVQQRTRELSRSLDDLRAAQDRLVQTEKLASLGQLTAGIAHEIKNPLNFVNNFSALSVELTDELNDVLKQAELAEKIEQEVRELTQLLKSNLEKIVQHGKRADSIVKNMLLHSREGSGEQRAADINALVEESLNLAYHGARAEKAGFDITLQRAFDAGAGSAELFPQEMTRALLNLISNGFYAATRRKVENGEAAFEPTLLATTKDLGHAVEIRIRDNGTGIPPEVKEKMFNPFFTTKPAGEGTGLGLSMTHDIIVKQHGGTIDVATEPGNFTEFIVVLPRANGAQKTRGQA